MTPLAQELARKQPANAPVQQQPKTIDGQFRAVHGGPTLRSVLIFFLFVILAAGLSGSLLSQM